MRANTLLLVSPQQQVLQVYIHMELGASDTKQMSVKSTMRPKLRSIELALYITVMEDGVMD